MDRPLEVAFHNLQPSPAIEAELREHVDKLERRFGKLIGCRVSVERLHNQHRTGNITTETHCDIRPKSPQHPESFKKGSRQYESVP